MLLFDVIHLNENMTKSTSVSRRSLYDVLGVAQDCDTKGISRAYRRLALKFHPDRNTDDSSDEMFKKVSEAYTVLSDPHQRRIYDATGRVPNGVEGEVSEVQRSVEIEDQMQCFFSQYRGSAEEQNDFMKQLRDTHGNFKKMVKEHLLFDNGMDGEVERLYQLGCTVLASDSTAAHANSPFADWMNTNEEGFALNTILSTWKSSSCPEERRKLTKYLKKERKEAEEALKAIHGDEPASGKSNCGKGDIGALQVMMQERQRQEWASMLSNMEAKYSNVGRKRSRQDSSKSELTGERKKKKKK